MQKHADKNNKYFAKLFFKLKIVLTDLGYVTQLLLITDYHEFGSLYDYLRKNTLTPRQVRIRIFFFH
jgi:hypothetical protein